MKARKKKEDPILEAWKEIWTDEFDHSANIGAVVRELEAVIIKSSLTFREAKEVLKIVKGNLNELKIGDGFKEDDPI